MGAGSGRKRRAWSWQIPPAGEVDLDLLRRTIEAFDAAPEDEARLVHEFISKGMRVQVVEPNTFRSVGDEGSVTHVEDSGVIHIDWDDASTTRTPSLVDTSYKLFKVGVNDQEVRRPEGLRKVDTW